MSEEGSYTSNLIRIVKSLEEAFRRNLDLTRILVKKIEGFVSILEKDYGEGFKFKIMDFCGTHEWTITHFGIRSLIPSNIELVAGPGCPVCVTPSYFIEESIKLALEGITIYTYGDVYRLKAIRQVKGLTSLSEAKTYGFNVKVVSNIINAINDSKNHGGDSVFIGIGFETVAPGYAHTIIREILPKNLMLLSLVKLTPPAMLHSIDILREKPTEPPIMGVIAPGHVSTITGAKAWNPVSENFNIPVVVSGFEPIDVLISITEILRQLSRGEAKTIVEYGRVVSWHGDLRAQSIINKVFECIDDAWRGIGFIPKSGLRLREAYNRFDAFREYRLKDISPEDWKYDLPLGCRCAEVIIGKANPMQCPLFMKKCTPTNPIGPCMVSIEGTCSIWARFGFGRLADEIAKNIGLT
ncbi:MAG: hydrogenase formation protein HypD [Candidatus Methanomethylicia archaeon]